MKLDGAKLTTARYRRGLTQTQVAEAVSSTTATISNAENGRDVYPATGKKICEFLGLDLADVVLPVEQEGDGDAA